MLIKKIKNNKEAFTLLEIMVAIGIMVILSSAMFLGNRAMNTGRNVNMSAYRLASEIRKMQSFTLNLQNYKTSGYPDGGWGISMQKDDLAYTTYADVVSPANHVFDSGTEELQEIKLPRGLKINNINVTKSGSTNSTTNKLSLSFEPPDPQTWICDGSDCSQEVVEIELSDYREMSKASVIINKFGLIDVK